MPTLSLFFTRSLVFPCTALDSGYRDEEYILLKIRLVFSGNGR